MTTKLQAAGRAPWVQRQLRELASRQGHAWLIHGPSALGQYEIGLELARSWLCEAPVDSLACGRCASCHQLDAKAHLDLFVLMPELLALELGWPLDEKAQGEIDAKKRKPSREIKVEAARDMVEFAQLTRSGRRCKVVLIHPAERMNHVTANTILKTLEEPAGESRFILCSEAAHLLLPTIRSRCQQYGLRWPGGDEGALWLAGCGVESAAAAELLNLAGGRPDLALRYLNSGRPAETWRTLPGALARGQDGRLEGWSLPDIVDVLQKICHDQMALSVGAAPRFFVPEALSLRPSLPALIQWSKDLQASARIVEHPVNTGLMAESLVWQARKVLNSQA